MNDITHVRARQEISTLDASDPRSVVNLVPATVKEALENTAFERPELFNQDESDLYKQLTSANKRPTPTDNRLRIKFWDEYDRVQAANGAAMNISNVLAGICSRELFYARYLKIPEKLAWLLTPPTGYITKAEEALEFGLEQLRDILEQPHVIGGRIDTKLGELKAKIVGMLDTRVKGAIVQKSMNLNVQTSNEQVAKQAMAATAQDLMKQLKKVEAENRRAQNIPLAKPDIEVEKD